jgi:ornithine cyclodeaminase/alanine dehydrogenase-like protein (mu-crystallin family)
MPSAARGVLILRSDELREAVPLAVMVDAVESAYRLAGEGHLAQRPRLQVRADGERTFLHLMGAVSATAGVAAAHVYTGGNRGAGVPQKVTLVFDTSDGGLRAIIESSWLSWARTGATGAVATRHLARHDAAVLGLIGAGKQAAAQLQAIAATRRLEGVYVYSRSPESRAAFAAEMAARTGLPVEALASSDDVVARAGIVSTATTSSEPVFPGTAVGPGLHVNAIGAHYPERRELDGATIARALVFVDDPDRSAEEDGELRLALLEGALPPGHVTTTLADVVAGRAAGRRGPEDVTVFLSGGLGSEYLAVAAAAVEHATRLGLGTRVDL